jgi:hypothetical protein
MENKKLTYEEIIGFIKNTSPTLEHPQEVTQTIMQQIEYLNKGKRKYKMIRITGLLSGVAACFFLCLLTYETIQLSVYSCNETKSYDRLSAKEITSYIFDTKRTATIDNTASEKETMIKILREKSERQRRKARIYTQSRMRNNNLTTNL